MANPLNNQQQRAQIIEQHEGEFGLQDLFDPVSMDVMNDPQTMYCSHTYDSDTLVELIRSSNFNCPQCRRPLKYRTVGWFRSEVDSHPNLAIKQVTEVIGDRILPALERERSMASGLQANLTAEQVRSSGLQESLMTEQKEKEAYKFLLKEVIMQPINNSANNGFHFVNRRELDVDTVSSHSRASSSGEVEHYDISSRAPSEARSQEGGARGSQECPNCAELRGRVTQMQSENAGETERINKNFETIFSKIAEIPPLKEDLRQVKAENRTLKGRVEELEINNGRLTKENANLRGENSRLNEDVQRLGIAEKRDLEQQRDSYRASLQSEESGELADRACNAEAETAAADRSLTIEINSRGIAERHGIIDTARSNLAGIETKDWENFKKKGASVVVAGFMALNPEILVPAAFLGAGNLVRGGLENVKYDRQKAQLNATITARSSSIERLTAENRVLDPNWRYQGAGARV